MGSDHLKKAKAALADAGALDVDLSQDAALPRRYHRLLDLAAVQARLATARALERIADRLDDMDRYQRTAKAPPR